MVAIAQALSHGAARLAAAGIDGARREARALLAHALGVPSTELPLDPMATICPDAFDALVARRAAREPLALVTAQQEFWSLNFAVTADTLVPRADSETLIEAAMAALPARVAVRRILDLGTGTGCLLLAALHEFPEALGIGVDRIPAAAALARRNAGALGLAARSAFLCGDWAAALAGRFDLVLCNPPYIRSNEIATLMPEVALHEPASALAGGPDGLAAYREVIPGLAALLADGGVAILELGCGQAADVAALATLAGMTATARADLAGIERALTLQLRR